MGEMESTNLKIEEMKVIENAYRFNFKRDLIGILNQLNILLNGIILRMYYYEESARGTILFS